jgi:hypothetical protein
MRPHFVKALIYPDGSHALFRGPRCIGRYDADGTLKTTHEEKCAASIRSAARLCTPWTSLRLAHRSPSSPITRHERSNIRSTSMSTASAIQAGAN